MSQIKASITLSGEAEDLFVDLERHNIKRMWVADPFTPSVVVTVHVRYPDSTKWYPYQLPTVERGSAEDAIRALNQLELQARIDPDEAQQARKYLARFAAYIR